MQPSVRSPAGCNVGRSLQSFTLPSRLFGAVIGRNGNVLRVPMSGPGNTADGLRSTASSARAVGVLRSAEVAMTSPDLGGQNHWMVQSARSIARCARNSVPGSVALASKWACGESRSSCCSANWTLPAPMTAAQCTKRSNRTARGHSSYCPIGHSVRNAWPTGSRQPFEPRCCIHTNLAGATGLRDVRCAALRPRRQCVPAAC